MYYVKRETEDGEIEQAFLEEEFAVEAYNTYALYYKQVRLELELTETTVTVLRDSLEG